MKKKKINNQHGDDRGGNINVDTNVNMDEGSCHKYVNSFSLTQTVAL